MSNTGLLKDATGPKSRVMATELGHLWAHMLQRGVLATHRSIGFCAIGKDEGSNKLAANLACFLGMRGKRLALVEASLRTPCLSEMFGVTGAPGLAEFLTEAAAQEDVVRTGVASGVDVIPSGFSRDPFWCFTGGRFEALQKELLADRDLVLVDVPALASAPEAVLAVRALDAVVLVVEANRHSANLVQQNVAYLRSLGTPFLGVVLTNIIYDLPNTLERVL